MTRIIEHRQDAAPGEELFELRVFQLRDGDVRACVVPADRDGKRCDLMGSRSARALSGLLASTSRGDAASSARDQPPFGENTLPLLGFADRSIELNQDLPTREDAVFVG